MCLYGPHKWNWFLSWWISYNELDSTTIFELVFHVLGLEHKVLISMYCMEKEYEQHPSALAWAFAWLVPLCDECD